MKQTFHVCSPQFCSGNSGLDLTMLSTKINYECLTLNTYELPISKFNDLNLEVHSKCMWKLLTHKCLTNGKLYVTAGHFPVTVSPSTLSC